jgi:uncharacterized membrane protein
VRLLKQPLQAASLAIERANDINAWIRERWAVRALIAGAVGMIFLYLHLEFDRTLAYFYPPLRLPVLTLVWLGLCAYLLYEFVAAPSSLLLGLLVVFFGGMLVKLVVWDLNSWRTMHEMLYYGDYSFLDASMRLLDFGAIIAFCYLAAMLLLARETPRWLAQGFSVAGLLLLFVYLTLEVNTFLFHYLPGLRAGGVSILWSLFALAMILSGIRKQVAVHRYVGLGLFAVVSWKVFFSDLQSLDQIYRIVAFIVLGVLALCGSFVYLKYRATFASEPAPEPKPALETGEPAKELDSGNSPAAGNANG